VSSSLDAARHYFELGWQPIPAPLGGKAPSGPWKHWQHNHQTPLDIERGFARPANVFLVTGAIGRLCVLDCDDEESLAFWRSELGTILDETSCVRTSQGWHFYFSLEMGDIRPGVSHKEGDGTAGHWDFRSEGGGVIAPPSVHESGREYTWSRDPNFLAPAPARLWKLLATAAGDGGGGGPTRSLLTWLLQNPASEGGRNVWLSKVAGHYALHIPYRDAFEELVNDANQKLSPPLSGEEVQKLIESIWAKQKAKEEGFDEEDESTFWREHIRSPTEENGYLVSGGNRILVQCHKKKSDGYEPFLATWLDCDIHALGIIITETDRQFSVELRFPDGRISEDVVSSKVLANGLDLAKWLARHGASIGTPDAIWPVKMRDSARILRYLNAQNPSPMQGAEALGWDEESKAFITHDGIIRKSGPANFEHVRPDPSLRKWAPYHYGHTGRDEARHILSEVLTFHDETVTAVFGAWWAAVLLKPQIQERFSQFPFMAIEAPSEAGKTKGFFPLMMQLAGYTGGNIQPTRASLRDSLTVHNNGIVWMDDLDSLDAYGEILRNVTVGGSMVKKGQDNASQVVATMRSALVISGESLGLRSQKALIDRAIPLGVSSPMGRRSLRDPERPQWDDIIDLVDRYPDLSEYAGSIIELALEQVEWVAKAKQLRQGSGRHADAMTILRIGARILRGVLNNESNGLVERVDVWTHGQTTKYTGRENALTLKLLPTALHATNWQTRPMPADEVHRRVATPVFVDEFDIVWFSPKLLAEWWVREPKANRKVEDRTESDRALTDQARELGLGGRKGVGRKDFKLAGTQNQARYWSCPPELSSLLIARSQGQDEEDEDESRDRLA
jgi:hypothetical protein